jgi:pimeloyl-ACP methyl ester carboxylesterase
MSRDRLLRAEDFVFSVNGQRLTGTRIIPAGGHGPGILALHGLGTTASRSRIRYLLDPLAEQGYGSVTFDFSGNGDSTGTLEESSLQRRRDETLAAARRLSPAVAPVVIGTSMGAHLAAWTVPQIRPRGLVLFCPAAYPTHAAGLKFDGSLARPGNYADSPAYAGLREFDGDLLIIGSRQDQVIPADVIAGYLANASSARSKEVIWLDGGDHFVHRWLPGQEASRSQVTQAITRLLANSCQAVPPQAVPPQAVPPQAVTERS